MGAGESPQPVKDEEAEHPVPAAWRPVISEIVRAFVRRDYLLADGIESVDRVEEDTADHICEYIQSYGETLVDLPAATWDSSVAQWMGSYWGVLVDLWTESEGRSDLVLHAEVR